MSVVRWLFESEIGFFFTFFSIVGGQVLVTCKDTSDTCMAV